MKRNYLFALILPIVLGFAACRDSAPSTASDQPLVRDRTTAVSNPDSEPTTLPNTGEGNFENLVGDYESKDRGIWQKPDMVISLLGDLENKTVADIGAGTGYFTFRLVPKAKKVIGIDIDRRFINFLDSVKVRLPEKYRDRFETRLAKPEDPLLKPEEVNAVMIVNTYAYIDDRIRYLRILLKGIVPGGQLLIIDFKKNNLPIGPPDEYKIALSQVERELVTAGFRINKIDTDALDYQYIVLAEKPAATAQ